ncbi:retrovirus-related pol polyprotein from transposon TNT 1-94 [Tanacetum coccineum]
MKTLAEFMIIAGADNRPPMLEKYLYDSWKSRIEIYIENRENRRMILNSVQNGPLVWHTVVEKDGTTRTKKYEELSVVEKLQADCDLKATNIVLQGLPQDVYAIFNHHKVAKEIWDRVKLLMQGTELSLQEKECKLYDEFDKFSFVKGETLYNLPPEWSKFMMDVKLARDLYSINYYQFHSSISPSQQYQSHMDHQTSNVPPIAYNSPQSSTQLMTEFPQVDSRLGVPVFTQGDAPIACLNKAMAFMIAVTVQQVQGRQGQSYAGTGYKGNATSSRGNNVGRQARVVKCYNFQGEGHMARQCTQPKRPRNAAWFKEKTTIPNTAAFQTKDLDAYDSNYDDVSNAKTVRMANLSNYGSDIILEVPHFEPYHIDMDNQSMHAMQGFEQTPVVDFTDNKIISDSNIIPYSQYLQETQQEAVQDTNLYA